MAPTAPIAPLTATLRPAELVEVEVALAVDVPVADPEWLVVVVIFDAPLEVATVLAADGVARGAEVVPAIWDWMAALNVPDMLAKVNLAENARAGKAAFVVSLAVRDSKRMK